MTTLNLIDELIEAKSITGLTELKQSILGFIDRRYINETELHAKDIEALNRIDAYLS